MLRLEPISDARINNGNRGEGSVNTRNSHDLNQVRPSAELHHPPGVQPTGRKRPTPGRRRRKRRPPPRKGWSLFAKIATALGVVVVLIGVGIAGFLAVVSPAELVRAELIRQVKANTGRELRINGGAHFIFYPNIGVSLGKVELSGPPGMAVGPMLTADEINLSVALMPLLSKEVHIEHVGLVRPVIDLHVDAQGRQSWQIAAATSGQRVRVAGLGAIGIGSTGPGIVSDALPTGRNGIELVALPAAAGAGGDFLEKLELRSIKLTKAVIRYRDDRSGVLEQLQDLDLQLTGRRISDPMKATGAVVWLNERIEFDARLDTLSQLIANRAAKTRFTLSGRPLSARFDGTVKLGDTLEVNGQTRLNGNSLAGTARWVGMIFPNAAPLGGFEVAGRLVASPKSVALNDANLSLGKTRATGVVVVAMRSKRPYISTDLKVSELDIDRLSAGFADARAVPRAKYHPPKSQGAATPWTVKPKSIEELLRRSKLPGESNARGAGRFAPQVRGYTNRNEWNSDRIDVSALGAVDAKARLRIAGLKVAGLSIGTTVLRLALVNQSARVDIDDIKLYGGSGKGVITARPGQSGIGIGVNLRVDGVAARALLKDAAGFDRLDGRGKLEVFVSGAGDSQKAIANSLNGKASFSFQDGAIVGWNLAKIIRGVKKGQFSNFDAAASEKTDFSELAASFQITSGIARTNDLRMTSPLLRLAGAGDVGIGGRNLNMGLRPRLVSSLRGQGASGGIGLEIPFKLKGPWHSPRIEPYLEGLTKDPSRLLDQAREIGKQFKGKSVGDIVRGVLGKNGGGGDQPAGGIKPKELLKKLFR
jgi:AsmA protein